MTDLVSALNEKYNRDDIVQNLSNKLSRGNISKRNWLKLLVLIIIGIFNTISNCIKNIKIHPEGKPIGFSFNKIYNNI